jgi:hypothetical protein
MASNSARAALVLTQTQAVALKELAGSRTAPNREVERAKVLLGYAAGIKQQLFCKFRFLFYVCCAIASN